MIIIVAATTCGLPHETLAGRVIPVMPQIVMFGDDAHVCALQVAAEAEAESLVTELKSKVAVSNIAVYQLPPAIVVHSGPKAMGVGFFVE